MISILERFFNPRFKAVIFFTIGHSISWLLAYALRFDFSIPNEYLEQLLILFVPVLCLKILITLLCGLDKWILRYFSVNEVFKASLAFSIPASVLFATRFLPYSEFLVPRGIVLLDFVLSIILFTAMRFSLQRILLNMENPATDNGGRIERIAFVGANSSTADFIKYLRSNHINRYRPVVILDQNKANVGRVFLGLPVLDIDGDFSNVAQTYRVSKIFLIGNQYSTEILAKHSKIFAREGVVVNVIPAASDVFNKNRLLSSRPIDVSDLLQRDSIKLDDSKIDHIIKDQVVAVTGAGGSIGSELCRQIARYSPRQLLLLEQSEPSLFQIEQELNKSASCNVIVPLICNILDETRVDDILTKYRPNIVFHAAAHKHVYLMERQPIEAIKNNTKGTRVLAELCQRHKVSRFVFISTDKAINPTSVMGVSKRMAEIHLSAIDQSTREIPISNHHHDSRNLTRFMAVRFGNVLGSSGSVVPIFKRQIEQGGPVTVTHPEVTRFFMTIPEASGLVLQAATMGEGGDIFVLDMGSPVKIVDLAKQMIELHGLRLGDDISIEFTGLKPGEKLYEEVQHTSENLKSTSHPRVMRLVHSAEYTHISNKIRELESATFENSPNKIKLAIQTLVPEYTPYIQ